MPLQLFGSLGAEVFRRRPQGGRRQGGGQRRQGLRLAEQQPAFHQGRQHGDVGGGGLGALVQRAHGMAGGQAGVPEQGEKAPERGFVGLLRRRFAQHQQVDVRVRVQLAAAVAAGGQQLQGGPFR